LTPVWAKLSMQPESSDGFASVGTILPKEKAALLPGGLFAFEGGSRGAADCAKTAACDRSLRGDRRRMMGESAASITERWAGFHPRRFSMHSFIVAVVFVGMVMAPCVVALRTKLDDAGSE